MPVRTVLFDLGGTLLVMERDSIFQKILEETGWMVSTDEVHAAYRNCDPWWLANYGSRTLGPEEYARALEMLDARVFLELFPSESPSEVLRVGKLATERWKALEKDVPPTLFPDAKPLLGQLKSGGYVLGLVSNASPDAAEIVDQVGLTDQIDHVVISGAVGFSKPDPEIFRIALRMTGGRADQTVHVGDLYEADVVGARNAGIRGILLDRDGVHGGADCPVVRNLSEVPGLLR